MSLEAGAGGRPPGLVALLGCCLILGGLAAPADAEWTVERRLTTPALTQTSGTAAVAGLTCAPLPAEADLCLVARCDPCLRALPDLGLLVADRPVTAAILEELAGTSECRILDLDVAVELEHSYVGDLKIDLNRPGAANTTLYSPPVDCGATAVDAIFDDQAPGPADACPAAGGARRRPSRPLSRFDGLPAVGSYQLRIQDRFFAEVGSLSRWGYALTLACGPMPPTPACVEDATTLCLSDDRFRVRLDWTAPQGTSGRGQARELTGDTGIFWFFDPDNIEVVVKVLDACPVNGHFWVFAGGLTDVELAITVEDTTSGVIKRYENPPRTPLRPIQDTTAFPACP